MELDHQVDLVTRAVLDLPKSEGRRLIAIGGPPASGKSTVAAKVRDRLTAAGLPCGLLPMDGFHLDNSVLSARGLLDRKGAPETFDLTGFTATLDAARNQSHLSIPVFDRVSDSVIPDGARITSDQRHVVVEGNYLFLDAPGWRDLARYWDYGVFIAPPLPELKRRLIQRWLDHGLSPKDAEARTNGNDLPNAELVLNNLNADSVNLRLS